MIYFCLLYADVSFEFYNTGKNGICLNETKGLNRFLCDRNRGRIY